MDDGSPVHLGGERQRALLAYLLLRANEPVRAEAIVSALWTSPPRTAGKIVQIYVSRLRRALGPELERLVRTEPHGYRLAVAREHVDLHRFEDVVDAGRDLLRAGDAEQAAATLRDALGLWRGAPLADLAGEPFVAAEVARLEDLRLGALEDRIDADLACGRHARVVGELEALAASQPLRERLHGQLMVALYRCGRQADALGAYTRTRHRLVEQLGIEPGPELKRLEKAILVQDRSLELATGNGPTNLPARATALVGRPHERETLTRLLRRGDVRLITLTGPPGVGKTRLALELASAFRYEFPGGVFLVELAPVTDPELVAATIATSLQVQKGSGRSFEETLIEFLHARRLLLVVDNFEHLLAAAPLVSRLLAAASELKVVATSRAALDLAGEREYPLSPLAVPAPAERDRQQLLQAPSVALFVERAQAVRPDLDLGDRSVVTIAEICRRLEGLPLSIELAAARLKVLPPARLLELLGRRLDVLKSSSRNAAPRHQTLSATIDWSYRLLSPAEQRLFRLLSVFAGGCGFEAAEAVCGACRDVGGGLESLVANSLLRAEGQAEPRFAMLETLREYAAERLRRSGEEDEARARHARWYGDLVERAYSEMGQPTEAPWLERLELEHDNVRAALAYVIDAGDATTAVTLSAALRRFWDIHGHLAEGRRWLEAALALDGAVPPLLRTRALGGAGVLAALQGDAASARAFFETSIALGRQIGAEARVATELANLGMLELDEGAYERAEETLGEALALRRKLGRRTVGILDSLGQLALMRGDLNRALAVLREAEAESREAGDAPARGATLRSLGRALIQRGDVEGAEGVLVESLSLGQSLAWRHLMAECFDALAVLAATRRDPARAATLLGCADGAREAIDAHRIDADHRWHDGLLAELTAGLGANDFAARYAEGRALPTDEAVELARAAVDTAAVG